VTRDPLLATPRPRIDPARMRTVPMPSLVRCGAMAFLLAAASSCGGSVEVDWRNRELGWRYGPTTGTATAVHLQGTGTTGKGAIAQGWRCHLSDGSKLTVTPYKLAGSHPLFGDVTMAFGLYDRGSELIETVVSPPITAADATSSFELPEATAKKVHDIVIWYRKA
jgi:hypothetical protein